MSISEDEVVERTEKLLVGHPPAEKSPVEFLGAQFDAGLAWVHFPEGHGGLGGGPKLQRVISEILMKARAPLPYGRNPIGYGMGAPTIVTHGSEQQRDRYLRPLFTGEEVWCQLFSEPGAGSDVASLSARAVRDGDEWIVNGQKVWTTLAHLARWGMLIARTDPEAPKHKGMTYFVVDMHAPGVEVKPLFQITGEAEFNEVFFTDVRIPDQERLGDVGEGWHVSLTTLMNERVAIGGQIPPRGGGFIGEAVKVWKAKAHDDPTVRDQLMKLWVRAEVLRLTNIRAQQFARRRQPWARGLDQQGSIGRPEQGHLRVHGEPPRRRRDAQARRLSDGPSQARHVVGQPAAGVPEGTRQLDRGRYDGDHEEHPRRADPRSSRRRPRRQGPPLVESPPLLNECWMETGAIAPVSPRSSFRGGRGRGRAR